MRKDGLGPAVEEPSHEESTSGVLLPRHRSWRTRLGAQQSSEEDANLTQDIMNTGLQEALVKDGGWDGTATAVLPQGRWQLKLKTPHLVLHTQTINNGH